MVLIQVNKSYSFINDDESWIVEIYKMFFRSNPECIVIHESFEPLDFEHISLLDKMIKPSYGFYNSNSFFATVEKIRGLSGSLIGDILNIIDKNRNEDNNYNLNFGEAVEPVVENFNEVETHYLGEIKKESNNNVLVYHKFFERAIVINNLNDLIYNYRDRIERFAKYKKHFEVKPIPNYLVDEYTKYFDNKKMTFDIFNQKLHAINLLNNVSNDLEESIKQVINYRFEIDNSNENDSTSYLSTYEIYSKLISDGGQYQFKDKEITFRELEQEIGKMALVDMLDNILMEIGYKQEFIDNRLVWTNLKIKTGNFSLEELVALRERELETYSTSERVNTDHKINYDVKEDIRDEGYLKLNEDKVFGKNAIFFC